MASLPLDGWRILLTNDDGIHADGLKVLEKIARALSRDVWVVAPETQQSAKSHALTVHQPLRPRMISARRFAVDGTPTDCVQLAMRALLPQRRGKLPCDLVLSGVNHGSNLAQDVLYSGTVAGALEGALFGIPAIAFSQMPLSEQDWERELSWDVAAAYGAKVAARLAHVASSRPTVYNVNFPACEPGAVKGTRAAHQGMRPLGAQLEARHDPRGRPYYWFHELWEDVAHDATSDLGLAAEGYITVTPISPDMTDERQLSILTGALDRAA